MKTELFVFLESLSYICGLLFILYGMFLVLRVFIAPRRDIHMAQLDSRNVDIFLGVYLSLIGTVLWM